MTNEQMEKMLEAAAKRGAKQALHELGLDDDQAGNDVRDLRTLITDFRAVRTTVLRTVVSGITLGVLGLLIAGASIRWFIKE